MILIPLSLATDDRLAQLRAEGYRLTGKTMNGQLVIVATR
jgi:hypothetical protein